MNWRTILLGLTVVLAFAGPGMANEKNQSLRGAAAKQAWIKPIQLRIDSAPLRETLGTLLDGRKLAWILDRRIDPDLQVSYTAGTVPLSEVIDAFLKPLHAQAIFLGDTVIVGPHESIQRLRTLAELQRNDLLNCGLPAAKISQLSRSVIWSWSDLTEPGVLVAEEARKLSITIHDVERLPYDLWGRGSLSGMTVGEALTVIAYQYDLRLHWAPQGKAELVPIQLPVEVSRVLPNFSLDRNSIQEELPHLQLESRSDKSVEVRGRIEDIEALEQLVKGTSSDRGKTRKPVGNWRTRKYTLKVENAPLTDLLQALKQQGIPVEWDEKLLSAAGIDFKLKINLDQKGATAEELIQAVCKQTGLSSMVDSDGIRLTPR